ncbi:MAG: GNAT family N-acetyltransferase [Acutalibacteraceae bacterium]
MLIASEEKYIENLSALWQKVFGDEPDYIDLFFKKPYYKSKTFAAFDGDKIVSVLYLMHSQIRFDGEIFDGFYLYAAATDPDYRKQGLMGTLLHEAEQYTAAAGKSYISLVPANEHLYDYYSKFGFETAMYKCFGKSTINKSDYKIKKANSSQYFKKRDFRNLNMFIWKDEELDYVLDCFSYYDIIPYVTEKTAFILDSENGILKELMCTASDLSDALGSAAELCCQDTLTFESYFGAQKVPFGMIYPVNPKLKRQWKKDDIYMNLALD